MIDIEQRIKDVEDWVNYPHRASRYTFYFHSDTDMNFNRIGNEEKQIKDAFNEKYYLEFIYSSGFSQCTLTPKQ